MSDRTRAILILGVSLIAMGLLVACGSDPIEIEVVNGKWCA